MIIEMFGRSFCFAIGIVYTDFIALNGALFEKEQNFIICLHRDICNRNSITNILGHPFLKLAVRIHLKL